MSSSLLLTDFTIMSLTSIYNYSHSSLSLIFLSLSLSSLSLSPDGYLYDKEAILECLLHQKRESEYKYI